jgi:hypothetical protein
MRNQKANAFTEDKHFDPNYEFGRMLRTKKGNNSYGDNQQIGFDRVEDNDRQGCCRAHGFR